MKTLEENFWSLKTWGSQKTLYPLKHSGNKSHLWVTVTATEAGRVTGELSVSDKCSQVTARLHEDVIETSASKKDVLKKRFRNFRALVSAE